MKEIFSYPKVNICFKILGFLPNNYCQIASRFVKVESENLRDTLYIYQSSEFKIAGNFDCKMQENTIFKAKEMLKIYLQESIKLAESQDFNHDNLGVLSDKSDSIKICKNALKILDFFHIEVEKKIPSFAGLGGGSSNAASFLLAINELLELNLSSEILCRIATKIGADVSFFIYDYHSANVFGIGEKVESFSEKKLDLEILTPPNIKCSTKAVFDRFRKMIAENKSEFFIKEREFLGQDSATLMQKNTRNFLNDLYLPALALYPQLGDFAKEKYFFSGSGSSFFCIREGR